MDSGLSEAGLTAAQYAALANLEESAGLSNAELARRSFVTPQTMVRIVAALEDRGLVTRTRRPGNARILETELTDAGREALAAGHRIVYDIEQHMSRPLTREQQATLAEILTLMLDQSPPP
jgi:DNA-binding MarR family transcriptional regulator